MRAYQPVAMILAALLLGSLVAACAPGPTTMTFRLITTGDLSVQVRARVGEHWIYPAVSGHMVNTSTGDELVYYVPSPEMPGADPLATTVRLTVEQAGLTTLTLEQWEQETSSGLHADSWLRKQAFFAISAPAGATLELPFADDTDPLEVQLKVDYNADGTIDAEFSPLVAAEGKNLEGERPKVEPVVEEIQQGQALVSFVAAASAPEPAAIYYSIYPRLPELQLYAEPFMVEEGSYILYGAVGATGTRQATRETHVLGGIAEAVRQEASIDGDPLEVTTSVPGQDAVATFGGEQGQLVEVEVGPASGGIQPRNQATLLLTSPDGTVLYEIGPYGGGSLGTDLWSFELDLPADGDYTIVIDPRLANVISTTVTISRLQ